MDLRVKTKQWSRLLFCFPVMPQLAWRNTSIEPADDARDRVPSIHSQAEKTFESIDFGPHSAEEHRAWLWVKATEQMNTSSIGIDRIIRGT